MKILLDKKKFLSLLQNANSHIVPKRSTLPIIQGVLMRVIPGEIEGNDKIEISSTDLEVFLSQTMQAQIDKINVSEGWVLDSNFLTSLLPKINSDTIILEFLKSTVKITVNGNTYVSPFLLGNEFPIVSKLKDDFSSIDYNTKVFKNYMSKCIPFASRDGMRPSLQGIHYTQKEKKVILESADAYKMIKAVDVIESDIDADIIIPIKFAETYVKIFDDENTTLKVDVKSIRLEGENFMLHGRLIDAAFPNTAPIFTQILPNTIKIKKEPIIEALRRLMIVNNTFYKVVKWNIKAEGLELTAENVEMAMSGKEKFEDFKCEGAESEIGLSPEFMIIALEAFRSKEIIVKYNDGSRAITMEDEHGAIMTLVMPIKI